MASSWKHAVQLHSQVSSYDKGKAPLTSLATVLTIQLEKMLVNVILISRFGICSRLFNCKVSAPNLGSP